MLNAFWNAFNLYDFPPQVTSELGGALSIFASKTDIHVFDHTNSNNNFHSNNNTSNQQQQQQQIPVTPFELPTLFKHTERILCVAVSNNNNPNNNNNNNNIVAVGSNDGACFLFDLQSGKRLPQFLDHSSAVHDVCFAPPTTTKSNTNNSNSNNEEIIIACAHDNIVSVWNLKLAKSTSSGSSSSNNNNNKFSMSAANTPQRIFQFRGGHSDNISCLCFNHTNDRNMLKLCSGARDKTLCLWDLGEESSSSSSTTNNQQQQQNNTNQIGATMSHTSFVWSVAWTSFPLSCPLRISSSSSSSSQSMFNNNKSAAAASSSSRNNINNNNTQINNDEEDEDDDDNTSFLEVTELCAAAGGGNTISLFSVSEHTAGSNRISKVAEIETNHKANINSICFSPISVVAKRLLITASDDKSIIITEIVSSSSNNNNNNKREIFCQVGILSGNHSAPIQHVRCFLPSALFSSFYPSSEDTQNNLQQQEFFDNPNNNQCFGDLRRSLLPETLAPLSLASPQDATIAIISSGSDQSVKIFIVSLNSLLTVNNPQNQQQQQQQNSSSSSSSMTTTKSVTVCSLHGGSSDVWQTAISSDGSSLFNCSGFEVRHWYLNFTGKKIQEFCNLPSPVVDIEIPSAGSLIAGSMYLFSSSTSSSSTSININKTPIFDSLLATLKTKGIRFFSINANNKTKSEHTIHLGNSLYSCCLFSPLLPFALCQWLIKVEADKRLTNSDFKIALKLYDECVEISKMKIDPSSSNSSSSSQQQQQQKQKLVSYVNDDVLASVYLCRSNCHLMLRHFQLALADAENFLEIMRKKKINTTTATSTINFGLSQQQHQQQQNNNSNNNKINNKFPKILTQILVSQSRAYFQKAQALEGLCQYDDAFFSYQEALRFAQFLVIGQSNNNISSSSSGTKNSSVISNNNNNNNNFLLLHSITESISSNRSKKSAEDRKNASSAVVVQNTLSSAATATTANVTSSPSLTGKLMQQQARVVSSKEVVVTMSSAAVVAGESSSSTSFLKNNNNNNTPNSNNVEIKFEAKNVSCLGYSRFGKILATGSDIDQKIILWEIISSNTNNNNNNNNAAPTNNNNSNTYQVKNLVEIPSRTSKSKTIIGIRFCGNDSVVFWKINSSSSSSSNNNNNNASNNFQYFAHQVPNSNFKLPNLLIIKANSVTCAKCKTFYEIAPTNWICNSKTCSNNNNKEVMWIAPNTGCETSCPKCSTSYGVFWNKKKHCRRCANMICSACVVEAQVVFSQNQQQKSTTTSNTTTTTAPSSQYVCFDCIGYCIYKYEQKTQEESTRRIQEEKELLLQREVAKYQDEYRVKAEAAFAATETANNNTNTNSPTSSSQKSPTTAASAASPSRNDNNNNSNNNSRPSTPTTSTQQQQQQQQQLDFSFLTPADKHTLSEYFMSKNQPEYASLIFELEEAASFVRSFEFGAVAQAADTEERVQASRKKLEDSVEKLKTEISKKEEKEEKTSTNSSSSTITILKKERNDAIDEFLKSFSMYASAVTKLRQHKKLMKTLLEQQADKLLEKLKENKASCLLLSSSSLSSSSTVGSLSYLSSSSSSVSSSLNTTLGTTNNNNLLLSNSLNATQQGTSLFSAIKSSHSFATQAVKYASSPSPSSSSTANCSSSSNKVADLFNNSLYYTQISCLLLITRIDSIVDTHPRLSQYNDMVSAGKATVSNLTSQYETLEEELIEKCDVEMARLRGNRKLSVSEKREKEKEILTLAAKTRRKLGGIVTKLVNFVYMLFPEFLSIVSEASSHLVESDGVVDSSISWETFDVDVDHPLSVAGHGARNNVFKATCRLDGKHYALKQYPLNNKKFFNEVKMFHRISFCPSLASSSTSSSNDNNNDDNTDADFFASSKNSKNFNFVMPLVTSFLKSDNSGASGYLVMPFASGGTFDVWIQNLRKNNCTVSSSSSSSSSTSTSTATSNTNTTSKKKVAVEYKIKIALLKILEGLAHLHRNHTIHSDLGKGSNIVMSSTHEDADPYIIDLDAARSTEELGQQLLETITTTIVNNNNNQSQSSSSSSIGGTLLYSPPEIHEFFCSSSSNINNFQKPPSTLISPAIDIWSYGLLYVQARDPSVVIQPGLIPKLNNNANANNPIFSEEEKDLLLNGIFCIDPVKRMSAIQILHRFQSFLFADNNNNNNTSESEIKRIKEEYAKRYQQQENVAPHRFWKFSLDNPLLTSSCGFLKHEIKPESSAEAASLFKHIQDTMTNTFVPSQVGFGRDSHGLHHKSLKLEKVFHLENASFWKQYSATRSAILQNRKNQAASPTTTTTTSSAIKGFFSSSSSSSPIPPVNQPDLEPFSWMKQYLDLKSNVNEVCLFHGLKPPAVDLVLRDSMDPRVCSTSGLLGGATYLASASVKSDQYVTPDSSGLCYFFLVRATLGFPYYSVKTNLVGARRPPCSEKNCSNGITCTVHPPADSVIGVTSATHSGAYLQRHCEYALYNQNQLYPEFLLVFRRVSN